MKKIMAILRTPYDNLIIVIRNILNYLILAKAFYKHLCRNLCKTLMSLFIFNSMMENLKTYIISADV